MSRKRRCTVAIAATLLLSGCGDTVPEVGRRAERLVYGGDGREELYDVAPGDALGTLARTSLLALGRADEVQAVESVSAGSTGGTSVRVISAPAQERLGLCSGERFGTQPAFALCSGFPVAPHFALTANHCVDAVPLQDLVALSGFYESAPGVVAPLTATQVHSVEEVVVRSPSRDVALVRLGGAALVPLRPAAAAPSVGDLVTSVNHGMGVPAKWVAGASAFPIDEDSFLTDLDAFGGASGAPVFNDENLVLGLLTSGSFDYDQTPEGCWTVRRQPAGESSGNELVEGARSVIDDLCERRFVAEVCGEAERAVGCSLTPGASHPNAAGGWGIFALVLASTFARRRVR